ncbi:MAG: ribosome maturation factor RimM [Frankiales bacterium]|nr:ribosome maturation factor RimM [Frankiales bacterium]
MAEAAPAAVVRPAESADGPPATPRPVSAAEPDLLVVGRIGKPQGLRGEVTVEVRTDEPDERFADGSVLLVEGGTLTVEGSRYQNGRLVVAFEGVPDRSAAELLRNTLLHVDAATLPLPEDPDVFLDNQLMGLRAELEDGTSVGVVAEVLHLPHGDVLVVKRDDGPDVARGGAREVLVPFLTAMVPVVDVAGGRLVMTPPEGLLELSEPGPEDEPEHDEQAAAEDQPAADVEQAAHEPQDDPA